MVKKSSDTIADGYTIFATISGVRTIEIIPRRVISGGDAFRQKLCAKGHRSQAFGNGRPDRVDGKIYLTIHCCKCATNEYVEVQYE